MASPLAVYADCCPVYCYAVAELGKPLIGSITIKALDRKRVQIEGATVRVHSETGQFEDLEFDLEKYWTSIGAELKVNLKLPLEKLEVLSGPTVEKISVRVYLPDGQCIGEYVDGIEFQTKEYAPIELEPKSIFRWIDSTDPSVGALASKINAAWDAHRSSDIDLYEAEPKRLVKEFLRETFDLIHTYQLEWVLTDYENEFGYLVGSPSHTLEKRAGNNGELAILLTSVIDALGLRGFIIPAEGEVFVAVALDDSVDESDIRRVFGGSIFDPVWEDIQVFQSSSLAKKDTQLTYRDAVAKAMNELIRCPEDTPVVEYYSEEETPALTQALKSDEGAELESMSGIEDIVLENRTAAGDLVERWKNELLDLTLRNRLLKMQPGALTLPLLVSDLAEFEDQVANGEKFIFGAKPQGISLAVDSDQKYHAIEEAVRQNKELTGDVDSHVIWADATEKSLEPSLLRLFREARASLQETGANILYLTLGILRWIRPEDGQVAQAPLLLIPVTLTRARAADKYVIHTSGEDTVYNFVLQEYTRRKLGFTLFPEQLPTDESGIDVPGILNQIRQVIMHREGWEVLEVATLSCLRFSTFEMWKDLENNREKLSRGPVVRWLMNGHAPENTDRLKLPAQVESDGALVAIEADASQLFAIKAATAGHSFVLHGPPGTGKSQVITGIIANALANNKRILFVAEKQAALEVVVNRLEKLGIRDSCLMLSEATDQKNGFIEQVQAAIAKKNVFRGPRDQFGQIQSTYDNKKKRLDAYAEALSSEAGAGKSIREAIESYIRFDERGVVELQDLVSSHGTLQRYATADLTAEQFAQDQDAVEKFWQFARREYQEGFTPDTDMPKLFGRLTGQLSDAEISTFKSLASRYETVLTHVLKSWEQVQSTSLALIDTLSAKSLDTVDDLHKLVSSLDRYSEEPKFPAEWYELPSSDMVMVLADLREYVTACERQAARVTDAPSLWRSPVVAEDPDKLRHAWAEASRSRMFLGKSQKRQQEFIDRYFGESDAKVIPGMVDRWIDEIEGFQQDNAYFRKVESSGLPEYLVDASIDRQSEGRRYVRIGESEEQPVFQPHYDLEKLRGWLRLAAVPNGQLDDSRRNLYRVIAAEYREQGNSSTLELIQTLRKAVEEALNARDAVMTAVQPILSKQDPTVPSKLRDELTGVSTLSELRDAIRSAVPKVDTMNRWARWCSRAENLRQRGLGIVEQALLEGFAPEEISDAFVKSVDGELVRHGIATQEALAEFSGGDREHWINEFKDLDQLLRDQARNHLIHILRQQAQDLDDMNDPQVGLILKRLAKPRALNIRDLLSSARDAFGELTPVMVMSPTTVAKYIEIGDELPFDIVIFDEASQLKTSKAIGALARARSAVIVGDQKQMPPTDFFNAGESEYENPDETSLDSILDECIALNMPETYLEWHYRSRYESLINFSNWAFYNSKLCTFPSAHEERNQVKLVDVQGVYEGGSRNSAEAQAIVEELERRFHTDPDTETCSIGVISFGKPQQVLIEDLLMRRFAVNPGFEEWATRGSEPLFVKNLENVQGDERNSILFSITFGRQKDGRVSKNFGPINKQGGERRLNVAFTRAREEMLVFSTMRGDDIKVGPKDSSGTIKLYEFLKYAESRTVAILDEGNEAYIEEDRDALADAITARLRSRGFKCVRNVGASTMRVDIAIKPVLSAALCNELKVDPSDEQDGPGYSAGILLDGRSFEYARSTRDREIAHVSVLENLQWTVLRVWAPDWWNHADRILDDLVKNLNKINAAAIEEYKRWRKEELKQLERAKSFVPPEKVEIDEELSEDFYAEPENDPAQTASEEVFEPQPIDKQVKASPETTPIINFDYFKEKPTVLEATTPDEPKEEEQQQSALELEVQGQSAYTTELAEEPEVENKAEETLVEQTATESEPEEHTDQQPEAPEEPEHPTARQDEESTGQQLEDEQSSEVSKDDLDLVKSALKVRDYDAVVYLGNFLTMGDGTLESKLEHVVSAESPIMKSYLLRRAKNDAGVSDNFMAQSLERKIEAKLTEAEKNHAIRMLHEKQFGTVLALGDQNLDFYCIVRHRGFGQFAREFSEISKQECIAALANSILVGKNVSRSRIIEGALRVLGFDTKSRNTAAKMSEILTAAVRRGIIHEEENRYQLNPAWIRGCAQVLRGRVLGLPTITPRVNAPKPAPAPQATPQPVKVHTPVNSQPTESPRNTVTTRVVPKPGLDPLRTPVDVKPILQLSRAIGRFIGELDPLRRLELVDELRQYLMNDQRAAGHPWAQAFVAVMDEAWRDGVLKMAELDELHRVGTELWERVRQERGE